MHNSIARIFFAGAFLFLCCTTFAQEKNKVQEILEAPLPEECSVWNTDDASRNACLTRHANEVRYKIDAELAERIRVGGWSSMMPSKTKEEVQREKFISFLIWLGGGLLLIGCIFVLFRIAKNKILLRVKQRTGKHTLDDVFAAENKNE